MMTIARWRAGRDARRARLGLQPKTSPEKTSSSASEADLLAEEGSAKRARELADRRQTSPELADEYLDALPTINAKYDQCIAAELDVALGKATPAQVLSALKPEEHDLTRAYTQHYRDSLELVCHNYGVNPETGKPDGVAAQLLLEGVESGMTDQEALAHACLAAHLKIPAQMTRDRQFQRKLDAARRSRRVEPLG